jgi:hypothetical protein
LAKKKNPFQKEPDPSFDVDLGLRRRRMGYLDNIMGDNEQIAYGTHQHVIVLLGRVLGILFAFAVFLAIGLVVLISPDGESGDRLRFVIGVIALGSLVMPAYLIVSAWMRGLRGSEFAWSIWQAALAGILIFAVALILMLYPGFRPLGWIALVIALAPLVEMVRIFLDWFNERYIITNRRVMVVRGTINKHTSDSALEKVNDVVLTQSIVGRILRYGTVQIITGSDVGVNMFRRISKPVRFKRAMLNAKEEMHSAPAGAHAGGRTMAETADSAEDSEIPDLILELDELRQKGILSEEEFQTKKLELLERL